MLESSFPSIRLGVIGWVAIWCTVAYLAAADGIAFPSSESWAAATPGGRGGQILRVTTLSATGPGSLVEALRTKGPRIVVFEVGGVIDLSPLTAPHNTSVAIREPFLTIAGQTAPSPGITLIRGGLSIETHDVLVQHIRVRPGTGSYAKKIGWEPDGMSTEGGGVDVIIDHCSFSWSVDENLSVSGKAFVGATADEWRKNTSHRVTLSNNIIAEGLSHATHASGEHSKGSLIMDNSTDILITRNLYADCSQRNPLAKGGTRVAIVNNFIFNPGSQAVGYRLPDILWHGRKLEEGQMYLVGNFMRAGQDTGPGLPMLVLEGIGDLSLYLKDNMAVDRAGRPTPMTALAKGATGRILAHPVPVNWQPGLQVIAVTQVEEAVLQNAGARPWDRDAIDRRIVLETRQGIGLIIDSEQQVGGYPMVPQTRESFDPAEWDLRTMQRR